jgi:hypothetical protein
VLGKDKGLDIAARIEIGDHAHPPWREQGYQVIQDGVGCRLMADLSVAIFIDVKLQAFQFHNILVWYVVNDDRSKIWEARSWAEAGELRNLKVGYVVPLRVGIGPCFQLAGLDFLYTVSGRPTALGLVIHDQLDFSSLGAYFSVGGFYSVL